MAKDRRYQKTKNAIYKTFVKLLTEKELNKISVKEITDLANINRATFYSHYKDIYDLYDAYEKDIFNGLIDLLNKDIDDIEIYDLLLNCIIDNKQLCEMIFSRKNSLFYKLQEFFINEYQTTWSKKYHLSQISLEIEYLSRYCVQGAFSMIDYWIKTNFSYPIDQLKEMISELEESIIHYSLKKGH